MPPTVHRFTVDRHSVETAIEAARLIRRVVRTDVLVVSALLHDIGKGGRTDHSVAGAPIAEEIARRVGFDDDEVRLVSDLVRHHLLLVTTATTRDPEDPATVEQVLNLVHDVETLDLLETLTEADARATGPAAWTDWRATLVHRLASRVREALGGRDAPPSPVREDLSVSASERASLGAGRPVVRVERLDDRPEAGVRVVVVAPDRPHLLADVSAALALAAGVRAGGSGVERRDAGLLLLGRRRPTSTPP